MKAESLFKAIYNNDQKQLNAYLDDQNWTQKLPRYFSHCQLSLAMLSVYLCDNVGPLHLFLEKGDDINYQQRLNMTELETLKGGTTLKSENLPDWDGYTLLTMATELNHTAVIKYLLENNAEHTPLLDEQTPLHIACRMGYLEAVKLLAADCLKKGKTLDTPCQGYTPLAIAEYFGHTEIIAHLKNIMPHKNETRLTPYSMLRFFQQNHVAQTLSKIVPALQLLRPLLLETRNKKGGASLRPLLMLYTLVQAYYWYRNQTKENTSTRRPKIRHNAA